MDEKMNIIIDEIVDSVKNDWTKDQKIRYVYLTLGKYLTKNVDFFFSLYQVLAQDNLPYDELYSLYEGEITSNEVICKSAANLLKNAYDKLGITSSLVEASKVETYNIKDRSIDISHWFLSCDGDDGRIYFLTLVPDLPNIQFGFQTEHFANDIPYQITNDDGKHICYNGGEILNTVLDDHYLRELDISIGYINTLYSNKGIVFSDYTNQAFKMIQENFRLTCEYYNDLEETTDFYRSNCLIRDGNSILKNFHDDKLPSISDHEWLIWKKQVIKSMIKEININMDNNVGENTIVIPDIDNYTDIDDLISVFKGEFVKYDCIHHLSNINFKEEAFDILKTIFKFANANNFAKENSKARNSFKRMFHRLTYNFIESDYIFKKEQYCPNICIAQKFEIEFKKTFDCDKTYCVSEDEIGRNCLGNISNKLGIKKEVLGNLNPLIEEEYIKVNDDIIVGHNITDFNKCEYAEQAVIIDKILDLMFQELNLANSGDMEKFNVTIPLRKNRINFSAVRHNETGKYFFLFGIFGKNDDDEYYYLYDPRNNTLDITSNFKVQANGFTITKRNFKPEIKDIEDIEIIKQNNVK